MDILRTPDDRFDGLDGFDFAPHYVTVTDADGSQLRVHHLDEGPAEGPVVLLMHGEPTWSYLYREVIPPLAAAGFRCIAPDLVGFGRSDKPADVADHTYARHVAWMADALFGALDLRGITMFAQDWGGLIGLRLVAADPDRFARVIVSNTGMPTGDQPMGPAFAAWQQFAATTPTFEVGTIVRGGCLHSLTDAEVAAYDAPFPDETFKAAPRAMPALVPNEPDNPASEDNRKAWEQLGRFERPLLCAFADSDPITAGGDRVFRKLVAGAADQPHTTIASAGHFVQEDAPAAVTEVIAAAIARG